MLYYPVSLLSCLLVFVGIGNRKGDEVNTSEEKILINDETLNSIHLLGYALQMIMVETMLFSAKLEKPYTVGKIY